MRYLKPNERGLLGGKLFKVYSSPCYLVSDPESIVGNYALQNGLRYCDMQPYGESRGMWYRRPYTAGEGEHGFYEFKDLNALSWAVEAIRATIALRELVKP